MGLRQMKSLKNYEVCKHKSDFKKKIKSKVSEKQLNGEIKKGK
jgi:hypothetical protein